MTGQVCKVLLLMIISTKAKVAEALCGNLTCLDGESCNPNIGECIPDAPPTSKLHVWLGDVPDKCIREPSDCSTYFMMDYDVSHPHGGTGDWCSSGEKIRCVVKDAPPLDPPTPDNELRVMTYNIFERWWFASIDGQRERTCRIPLVIASLYPNVDVITFQELFMAGCWSSDVTFRDLLVHIGFPHQTKTITSPTKVTNGGIFIASRWPIIESDDFTFKSADRSSWDNFSAKGVSFAKIQKGSAVYNVMGTHLQAGRKGDKIEAKVNQSIEWGEFVKSKNIPVSEPLIFAGDLNANFYDGESEPEGMFDAIVDNIEAIIPTLVGALNASSNPLVNDLQKLKGNDGWGRWIDHVFYSNSHLPPRMSYVEILAPKDETPFPICWCEQCINPLRWSYVYPTPDECSDDIEFVRSLSDHQPVMGTFIF